MRLGYFSLIQFCPDAARMEAVNVGLVLYVPEVKFFGVRTARGVSRIHRAFGHEVIDARQFDLMRLAAETTLKQAATDVRSVGDFVELAASFANEIQLTPPRPATVNDQSWAVFDSLFERLVGTPPVRPRRAGVRERLDEEFAKPEYADKISRHVEVPVPDLGAGRTMPFPYGYSNGKFNVIHPAYFPNEGAAELIGRTGRVLFEASQIRKAHHPRYGDLRLVVVGEFADDEGDHDLENRIAKLLRDNDAKFYNAEHVPDLIGDIRRNAKPLPRIEQGLV